MRFFSTGVVVGESEYSVYMAVGLKPKEDRAVYRVNLNFLVTIPIYMNREDPQGSLASVKMTTITVPMVSIVQGVIEARLCGMNFSYLPLALKHLVN